MARHHKAEGGSVAPSETPKNKHETDPEHPVFPESAKKEGGFKRGGRKHRKHGGHVMGHKGHHRLDKRARGGGVLSSAASSTPAKIGSSNDEGDD